jgi:hypothetical protein
MQGTLQNTHSSPTTRNMGWFGIAAAVGVTFYVAVIAGPEWRKASERQLAAEIKQESQVFCDGLGFREGTDQGAQCENGAALIRAKQKERSQAEALGIR